MNSNIDDKKSLQGDLTAGFIVTVLFIPQSMAYANIAGVDPVYGLYASAIPLLCYTILGSSKFLSVGPTSIISILAFSTALKLAEPESIHFYETIILLTLLVGIIQLTSGFLNFGRLFEYISPNIISGFTPAAAIIIALNQFDALLGIHLSSQQHPFSLFINLVKELKNINPVTSIIGISSLIVLYFLKKNIKLSIAPFFLIIICPIIVKSYHLQKSGVDIVGYVPTGLPELAFPIITMDSLLNILPSAVTIAFISILESYAVAKSVALKINDRSINTKKELIGIGIANVSSSILGSIPVGGAFSRTAVSYEAGAKTKMANVITVLLLLITIVFFTSFFYYLPNATLAAIVIISVSGLINITESIKKCSSKIDQFIILVTFLLSLTLGILQGLLIGVAISLIFPVISRFFSNK